VRLKPKKEVNNMDFDTFESELKELFMEKINNSETIEKLIRDIFKGASEGMEIGPNPNEWIERLKYQFVWLDKDDYSRALVRALWLAPVFAGTDFGSSRQRDMGQVWTDTARGFLGEIALTKFLGSRFYIETKIDTRRGDLKEFLPTDISLIKKTPNSEWRSPNLKISIKTTKFNGRWLDLPGDQFSHSDIFILIKLGILRQHFLAFLKALSFLRDKLFAEALRLGELDVSTSKKLWQEIPEFEPIPAYIAGFLKKDNLNMPIHMVKAVLKGRKDKMIVITQGIGLFSEESLREHPSIIQLDPERRLPIHVDPILKPLRGAHFLANSGGLQYGEDSWKELVMSL